MVGLHKQLLRLYDLSEESRENIRALCPAVKTLFARRLDDPGAMETDKLLTQFHNMSGLIENLCFGLKAIVDAFDSSADLPTHCSRPPALARAHASQHRLELDTLLIDPPALCCPLSFTLFRDPVTAPDGVVYERETLENCLERARVSPLAGQDMCADLQANIGIRDKAMEWRRTTIEKLLDYASAAKSSKRHCALAVMAMDRCVELLSVLQSDGAFLWLEGAASGDQDVVKRTLELLEALGQPVPRGFLKRNEWFLSRVGFFGCSCRKESIVDWRRQKVQSSPGSNRCSALKRSRVAECLDILLATEEGFSAFAKALFLRFDGEVQRLWSVEAFLKTTWGFPNKIVATLRGCLPKAVTSDQEIQASRMTEQDWELYFGEWLRSVRERSKVKVERKAFVHKYVEGKLATFEQIYFHGKQLGAGAFGEVFLVHHASLNVKRVVKAIHKAQLNTSAEDLEGEVSVLKALDHPFIVRIYEAFDTANALHIVMDHAEGGDLASLILQASQKHEDHEDIPAIPELWISVATSQIAAALAYMHWKGVVHCDLKPANAMLLRQVDPLKCELPHVLLVDFGLSELFSKRQHVVEGGSPVKVKGTPAYLAPEGFNGMVTDKSDIWALGVVIYEMFKMQRPFKDDNIFVLWGKVTRTEPDLNELPTLAHELVSKLLAKVPGERPAAREILRSDWLLDMLPAPEPVPKIDLKFFGHSNFFVQTVMLGMASELSMKDRPDIFKNFRSLDNNEGRISAERFKELFTSEGKGKEVDAAWERIDMDHNGFVSYTEFLAASLAADSYIAEPLLKEAFCRLDIGGEGFITKASLQATMYGEDGFDIEVLPDGYSIDDLVIEVGQGEGKITFDSFRTYMAPWLCCLNDGSSSVRRSMDAQLSVPTQSFLCEENLRREDSTPIKR